MINESHDEIEARQVRRERRLKKKRERMKKHGKSLAVIYQNAILKRLRIPKGKRKK
ncbi:MAG: hypothetical protein ABIB93_08225 [Chloroflexota bacterium]